MYSTGEIIKKLRKEKKITADEMAKKLGVNRSTYYRYESGEIEKMPYTVLKPISDALGVSPMVLLGIEHKRYNENRLLSAFSLLTQEQQEAVIIMVEGMVR